MEKISEILNAARLIESNAQSLEAEINARVEHNLTLFKALATIKNSLERGLKQPKNLANAVYESIDIARSLTPYTEMSTGITKLDPPLTDAEKTLNINCT